MQLTLSDAARRNAAPYLFGTEADAAAHALAGGQYGHSPLTDQFENEVAAFLGTPDIVAVASGTFALHFALLAAGIRPGDEVIVPSMTFCATVQAVLAAGARPRFCDVDPDTLCAGPEQIEAALTPDTRAVMPVLFAGRAVDLAPIEPLLTERGITVVEDAAHGFGSLQGTTRVGATGRLTCFSFGPIKNLTCGQGGAVVPTTVEQAATVRRLRLLGVVEDMAQRADSTTYTVAGPGYRAPLSAINAAVGLVQLGHFAEIERRRRHLWTRYRDALAHLEQVTLVDIDPDRSVPSMCVVRVENRDRIWRQLHELGLGVGVHYPPNHLQPAFADFTRPLPVTEHVADRLMSLPFHLALTDDDVGQITAALVTAVRVGSQ